MKRKACAVRILTVLAAAVFVLTGCARGGSSKASGQGAVISIDGSNARTETRAAGNQSDSASVPVKSVKDENGYDYDQYTDHIQLGRYHGVYESEMTVPSEIGGLPVTELGDDVYYKGTMEKVILPEGISYIGYNAFRECKSLKEVVLPKSIKVIKKNAFCACTSLDTINVPDDIEELGERAFAAKGFTSFTLPSGLKAVPNELFRDTPSLTEVIIPEGVEKIGKFAFYGCHIESVRIPDSLTEVGNEAFSFRGERTIRGSKNSIAKKLAESRDYAQSNVKYVEE